ncbi:MAG: PEGA domain-containing protein [Defluviitaleaceae bacterium]|nr:PEGA domain-containing protein [Defluviitaleaceae bacterium]MCL2263346.1 PEGA domain-containing protein [Defluviitaleaceae bacterium]
MSNNRFGDDSHDERPLTGGDYDDYNSYDDDYDNFKYDSYDDDDFSLTREDAAPLTSSRSESRYDDYDEEPLERETSSRHRSQSRRETIQRVAEDQQSGITRKPGVTSPDPRIAALSVTTAPHGSRQRNAQNSPAVRRANRAANGYGGGSGGGNRRPPSNTGRHPNKSKFAMFYIAFLLLAVSVCLVVLVVVLPGIGQRFSSLPIVSGTPPTVSSTDPAGVPIHRADLRSQTALITSINFYEGTDTLELLDINSRRSQEYTVPSNTIITGRNGRIMIFDELRVGDIIDIRYDSRNLDIATINENQRRWERVNRPNVNVNMDELVIVLNNDVWNFNSQTLVLHNGEDFSIGQIRPYDFVTLVGYGDTVWLVRVETAHGFLQFHNTDRIVNGFAMVGSDQYIRFDENMPDDITLPEGMHRVMIDGDNIETTFQNIRVIQGQTARINLTDIDLLTSQLFFSVTPENAQIFINGTQHVGSEPATVEFGEVLIRVEMEGYHPQQQEFVVTTTLATAVFELEAIEEERPQESTLIINTSPSGAIIYINNVFAGSSPLRYNVPPGMHSVVARSPGHESSTISVPVTGTETTNIERTLVLMPVINDPFANQPPQPVEPIPEVPFPTPVPTPPVAATPAPFPTLPPQFFETPAPPAPPVENVPLPTLPPADVAPPAGLPTPLPPPTEEIPWWLQLPGF